MNTRGIKHKFVPVTTKVEKAQDVQALRRSQVKPKSAKKYLSKGGAKTGVTVKAPSTAAINKAERKAASLPSPVVRKVPDGVDADIWSIVEGPVESYDSYFVDLVNVEPRQITATGFFRFGKQTFDLRDSDRVMEGKSATTKKWVMDVEYDKRNVRLEIYNG